jgi:Tfp pilus assembly protein PilV
MTDRTGQSTHVGPARGVRLRCSLLRDERGMTLVEVLMAAFVLIVGMLGAFIALTSVQSSTTTAETAAVLAQAGQQTLQSIEALPYADIADSTTPTQTSTTNTDNPTYYLSTCGSSTCYRWNQSSASSAEPLAIDTTHGLVNPGPVTGVVPAPNTTGCTTSSTSACRITYSIYAFITNSTDSVCGETGVTCASPTSYKRVTVAVWKTGPGPPYVPVYISTFVSNKIGGSANPLTQSGTTCLDGSTTVACEH